MTLGKRYYFEEVTVAILFFLVSLGIPFLHLQFVKNQLKKRRQEFGLNRDTLTVMYMGSISSIVISSAILLAEALSLDTKIGSVGYLFAIFAAFLVYELYIQKSE